MPEPLRTAVVGYGYWGANLARNVDASAMTELVGVCDPVPERRALATTAHRVDTWSDVNDVLAEPAVEAVILATPAATHSHLAVQVLRSGRHVLVEKPLALDVAGAEAVVNEAQSADRVAMVGHTFLYSPPVIRLREYLRAGELGQVQYVYSQRLSLGRIRTDCDALWNFAPHDVSILLFLLEDDVVEVSATGFSFIQTGISDVYFVTLRFASGVGANLHVSWVDPRKTRLMTVVGDRKMAVYDDVSADQKILLYDAGAEVATTSTLGEYRSMGEFQWRVRAGDILIPKISMTEPLLKEIDAFAESCRSGEEAVTSAGHGLAVVRVLAAAEASAATGGAPVKVS